MDQEILVTVICITFNQDKYLKTALESMLKQKTTFRYEIIVHDDVSTDSTREIINSYKTKYPEIVRPIFENENQYSQGVDFVLNIILNEARGKYIAFCEGDDFWIDENKLEIQYQALEKHPECDMCACCGSSVSEDGNQEIGQIRPSKQSCILNEEDIIYGGGLYIATAGLFFRKNMYDNIMEFEKYGMLDYITQIKGGLRGGIYYIDRKMAAYRRNAQNSWTINVLHNEAKLRHQWDFERKMLLQLDRDTDGKYHKTIEKRLLCYTPFENQLETHKKEILRIITENPSENYIWGMGRRGEGLEKFFFQNKIKISGVCDAMNNKVGMVTKYGNKIVNTNYVMNNANVIYASVKVAYDDLLKTDFQGKVVNFQQYMPLG